MAKYKVRSRTGLDATISKGFGLAMFTGNLFTITYRQGFEEFGSYETWDSGYVIQGKGLGEKEIKYSHKHLETAIEQWFLLYHAERKRLEEKEIV